MAETADQQRKRAWREARRTACPDCGELKSPQAERCQQCSRRQRRAQARERVARLLELRRRGLANVEIERVTGIVNPAVALQRERVEDHGLEWVPPPTVRGPRKGDGITRAEAARRLGLSSTTVTKLANGGELPSAGGSTVDEAFVEQMQGRVRECLVCGRIVLAKPVCRCGGRTWDYQPGR